MKLLIVKTWLVLVSKHQRNKTVRMTYKDSQHTCMVIKYPTKQGCYYGSTQLLNGFCWYDSIFHHNINFFSLRIRQTIARPSVFILNLKVDDCCFSTNVQLPTAIAETVIPKQVQLLVSAAKPHNAGLILWYQYSIKWGMNDTLIGYKYEAYRNGTQLSPSFPCT